MPSHPAISYLQEKFPEYLEDLKTLVRIPSVSFHGFPAGEVRRSAQAVADLMRKRGLENVEILELEGAHPYVYGDWLHAPGAPTLLLYAHHDVQPPGREEKWRTKPFEPTILPGPGGDRMYARGSADDKAGIVIHTSSIDACLKTAGKLPVNVKIVIEGEEEIGSKHLSKFLSTYRKKLDADVLVLTDTSNFDCGVPALTVALRGLVGLQVEVRALHKTVHSGMWGGPLPDPAMALIKMLSGLTDERGRIAVPGVLDQVKPLSASEKAELSQVPCDVAEFRKAAGLVDGAELLGGELPPSVEIWRFPSLTINAIQASSRAHAGNIINDAAWAYLTVRLVHHMDAQKTAQALQDFLRDRVPWGLEVKFHLDSANGPWMTEPTGVAFEAAVAALEAGYGKKPYKVGCGGSIPFVHPFAEALGGAPALLIGVEDPYTDAHGENESLLISDLKKSALSQIHLYEELARRWKK